jgi:hypothetical protein
VLCSVAHADFFHDDIGAISEAGDEQPGVISTQLIAVAVPAEAGVRGELGDLAGDPEAERFPVETDILAELARRVTDDDVAGVRMTTTLCAKRSAWAGSKPSGQRILAERSMTSSFIVVMPLSLVITRSATA